MDARQLNRKDRKNIVAKALATEDQDHEHLLTLMHDRMAKYAAVMFLRFSITNSPLAVQAGFPPLHNRGSLPELETLAYTELLLVV